jgi:hypothetical protein
VADLGRGLESQQNVFRKLLNKSSSALPASYRVDRKIYSVREFATKRLRHVVKSMSGKETLLILQVCLVQK